MEESSPKDLKVSEKEKLHFMSNFSFSCSFFNPFPNKPWFLRVCSTSLLKTLREKEKLLVTSNFSFSHSVFYPFGELSAIFIQLEIVVCKLFQFGRVQNLLFGKGLKDLYCRHMKISNVNQKIKFVFQRVEYRGHYHFSPSPTIFSKGFFVMFVQPFPKQQILHCPKLKELEDNNSKFNGNGRKFSKWVENTVGKGEIAHNKQFLPFPRCFFNPFPNDKFQTLPN